jgi:hypothetical protein
VGFEVLPLEDDFINNLYRFLPFDMVKTFPDDRGWVHSSKGIVRYSVPKGWTLHSDLKNNAVYHISKGVNQIILRITKGIAPLNNYQSWRDKEDFLGIGKKVAVLLLPIFLMLLVDYPKFKPVEEKEEVVVILTKALPTPEPTPVPTEKPTEKPTQVAKVEPTPRPKPSEPIKKIVKKITPPKPQPQPRLVVEQKPQVVRGGTGPQNLQAKADQVAKAQAVALAQTKAKISSALGFLANTNGLIKVPADQSQRSNTFMGGRGLAGAKNISGPSTLANLSNKNGAGNMSGPINTSGSRTIASGPVVSNGEIYGKEGVRGKVSASGIYSAGGSGSFGPAGSMAVSGNIDQNAVRQAIEKYMKKIQYCYERALLSKPKISGSLKMQWSIAPGGRASGVSVVSSALNDVNLHNCVSGVIAVIPFPSPKGGSATVSYPFNFTPFQ